MKTPVPLGRIIGTLLLTAFLVLALFFAVQGAFQTRASIADTFSKESEIQQAQLTLEELLREQIHEESLLRGYSLTRDPFYVDQYRLAAAGFDVLESSIERILADHHLDTVQKELSQYARLQEQWRQTIAAPVLRHPDQQLAEIDKRNKYFSDVEASAAQSIRDALAQQNTTLARFTAEDLTRSSYSRAFWLLVFGLLAILFNAFRSRLYRELEEERMTTETLQRAFRSESVPLPHCSIGSAYLSATSHLAVGGDVFDVYRLSENRALLLIADVSGKGVDAAVLTAFIKFNIRGIALRRRDPGEMLAEFNTAFTQAVENPYLFVSMFVGVLDTDTFLLRYASAGHDSAFVRRSGGVEALVVTGPVLGVMEEPFGTRILHLERNDMLVLATDGLTEARSRSGALLQEDGAKALIAKAGSDPQEVADNLSREVRALSGNRLRDDLAILAIRVDGPVQSA